MDRRGWWTGMGLGRQGLAWIVRAGRRGGRTGGRQEEENRKRSVDDVGRRTGGQAGGQSGRPGAGLGREGSWRMGV